MLVHFADLRAASLASFDPPPRGDSESNCMAAFPSRHKERALLSVAPFKLYHSIR